MPGIDPRHFLQGPAGCYGHPDRLGSIPAQFYPGPRGVQVDNWLYGPKSQSYLVAPHMVGPSGLPTRLLEPRFQGGGFLRR